MDYGSEFTNSNEHEDLGLAVKNRFIPIQAIKTGYHEIERNRFAAPNWECFFQIDNGINDSIYLFQIGAQFSFKRGHIIMRKLLVVVSGIIALITIALSAAAADPGFKVVINQSNTTASITKAQLSRCFMKQANTWINGQAVLPVDQAANTSVRKAFSTTIHDRNVNAIKSFWQRQIFSGRGVPPSEKASDDEVLAFVAANPGAVGYVSPGATVGAGLKVLEVTNQ